MTLDRDAVKPEKNRAVMQTRVKTTRKPPQRRRQQQSARLRAQTLARRRPQLAREQLRRAFRRLQGDVAREAVRDHDISPAARNVMRLYKTEKRTGQNGRRRLLQNARRLADLFVSLDILLAYVEQRARRRRLVAHRPREGCSHDRELNQIRRRALQSRAEIQQHHRLARARQKTRDRRTMHALHRLETAQRHRHQRARVAARNRRDRISARDRLNRAEHGGLLSAAQGERRLRVVRHLIRRVQNLASPRESGMTPPLALYHRLVADKQKAQRGMPLARQRRSRDRSARRVLAAHGVNREYEVLRHAPPPCRCVLRRRGSRRGSYRSRGGRIWRPPYSPVLRSI